MCRVADIVLNFRTSFVNKNGQVCYDSRLIALNYMRGWFLLDLLAAIPFDLLYAFDVDTVSEFRHGPALSQSRLGADGVRAVVMDLFCLGSM